MAPHNGTASFPAATADIPLARETPPSPPAMARLMPAGVRGRLFMLISLVLLPLVVLIGWIHYKHYTVQYERALDMELEVAEGVATTFDAYLDGVRHQIGAVGHAIAAFDVNDVEGLSRLMRSALPKYHSVRNLSWAGPDGLIRASTAPALVGRSVSDRAYFRRIVAGEAWATGPLTQTGKAAPVPTFAIASAVRGESERLSGLVIAGIEPTRLGEALTRNRPTEGIYFVFDPNGVLVYRSGDQTPSWKERVQWQANDPLLRMTRKTGAAQVGITRGAADERRVAARVPVGAAGWITGASRSVAEVLGPLQQTLWRDGTLALLVVTLAFGLAILVARTISDPLRRLEADARALGAGGRISASVPLDPVEVRRLRFTVLAMASDLLRRAAALQESDARFRQLADAMPQLVWTADPDGRVDYYNERYREYDGIQAGSGGFDWAPVLHEDDVDPTVDAWRAALAAGEAYQVEHRVRRADGSLRWHLSRGVPVRNPEGAVVKWFGTATDIHDLKTAEEALRRERAQLQALLDHSPVLISITDLHGIVLLANKAIFELADVPPPERFIGRSLYASFPRDVAAALSGNDQAALRSGGAIRAEENIRHRDGGWHTYLSVKFPVSYLDTGEPFGICSIATDITEAKQAQEQLRRNSEQLARANAELEEFAYAASHDLKAPLRAVANLAYVIDEEAEGLDPENRERLRMLRSRITVMHRLIDGLLDYARLGKARREPTSVPLYPLIMDLWEELELPPGYHLMVDERLPTLCADASQLRHVFQNLISNAVDHHDRDQGQIWVRACDAGSSWCIEVADDGPGIPAEDRDRIFRMFSSGKPGNTGIGLAIVRKLVSSHGGRIDVQDNRPRGTVFRISWPKRQRNANSSVA